MTPTAPDLARLDRYVAELSTLPAAEQLELIARLSRQLSLVSTQNGLAVAAPVPVKASILDFAGAWEDMPGTTEELIADIYNARTFSRPDISLDEQ